MTKFTPKSIFKEIAEKHGTTFDDYRKLSEATKKQFYLYLSHFPIEFTHSDFIDWGIHEKWIKKNGSQWLIDLAALGDTSVRT